MGFVGITLLKRLNKTTGNGDVQLKRSFLATVITTYCIFFIFLYVIFNQRIDVMALGRCFGENNGFVVLRQSFSGRSIPALRGEDSPMNLCVLGHRAATTWQYVQTRGKFIVL